MHASRQGRGPGLQGGFTAPLSQNPGPPDTGVANPPHAPDQKPIRGRFVLAIRSKCGVAEKPGQKRAARSRGSFAAASVETACDGRSGTRARVRRKRSNKKGGDLMKIKTNVKAGLKAKAR